MERSRGRKRPGSSIQLNARRGLCCPHISGGDTRPHFVTPVPPPFNVMGSNFACDNPRNIKHPKPDIDSAPYHRNPTAVYILQGTNIGYRFHLRLLRSFTLQMRQTMCAINEWLNDWLINQWLVIIMDFILPVKSKRFLCDLKGLKNHVGTQATFTHGGPHLLWQALQLNLQSYLKASHIHWDLIRTDSLATLSYARRCILHKNMSRSSGKNEK